MSASATATTTNNNKNPSEIVTPSSVAGRWKITRIYKDNEDLSIDGDGDDYYFELKEVEGNNNDNSDNARMLGFSTKISNLLRTRLEMAGTESDNPRSIGAGPVMSTRMMAGTDEKRILEGFLDRELPRTETIRLEGPDRLVLETGVDPETGFGSGILGRRV